VAEGVRVMTQRARIVVVVLVVGALLVLIAVAGIGSGPNRPLEEKGAGLDSGAMIGQFLGSLIGVLGAILIFYLETRRGRVQEQHRRDRELVGLLLLVYSEMSTNRELLKKFSEDWRLFWSFPEHPASSVWEDLKGRLVVLAPPEVSAGLIAYHRLLRALLVHVDKDPSGLNAPVFEEYIAELLQTGIIVV
jgi:hypothetical protein